MKKSDLKTGMILEFAGGKRAMVYLGTQTGDIISGDMWYPLHEGVDEDLKATRGIYSDVVKVLQPIGNIGYKDGLHSTNHKVIWERPKETTYKIGQRFRGEVYDCILCQVLPFQVCLVDLREGNRINNPVVVNSAYKITEEEFEKISGSIEFKLKETEE